MKSLYHSARFLLSSPDLRRAPPDTGAEVAFVGRSNAGKSSALNALTGQSGLARTSKTPGRTQLLNFFSLDDDRRLVDLPGYGYARVPEAVKRRWQAGIAEYLQGRESLRGLVLVMDVRHPLKELDRLLIEGAVAAGLPCHALLTKADKVARGPAQSTLLQVRKALAAYAPDCSAQLFSAPAKQGIEALRAVLDGWLELPVSTDDGA